MFFGTVRDCEEILPDGSTHQYDHMLISPAILGEADDEFHEEVLPALNAADNEQTRIVGSLVLEDQTEV